MRRWIVTLAAMLLALLGTGRAWATTATGTMSVTVQVLGQPCDVSGEALDFGTYTSGQATSLFATTAIDFNNCGPGTLSFELDGGRVGNAAARKLQNGSATLSYGLYQDTGRSVVFGSGGTGTVVVPMTSAGAGKVNVYGRIPARQKVAPGTYTDTVGITLTF